MLADHDPEVRDRHAVVEAYARMELPRLRSGHQIVVSASLAEGFSLAVPEAMACGLAPVVTALDGPRAIIRDGDNGRLVAPADADALAAALQSLVADRDELARMRSRAHATVQDLGWPAVAAHQLELYVDLLRHRLVPRRP